MFKKIFVILATSTLAMACTKRAGEVDNSIRYSLRVNLKGMDPAQAAEEGGNEVMPNIYETLYEYHYLKRPLEMIPLLAEGMPTVSKDATTFTIKLRPGVKFQDSSVFKDGKGREVVASDFIYSWKRIADPRLKGEGFWIFDKKVKGLNEWRDKLAKNEGKFEDPIEGFSAPDDHTLVIKLAKPSYQFAYILAMPYTSVVPHEAVEKYKDEFMNHPVGTGPFMFESWTRGNKLTLVRNPNWHGGTYPTEGEAADKDRGLLADAGKALPFVDQLVFFEIIETQPRWLNLMKGALDFMGVPKDNFDAAIANGKLKPELEAKGVKLWNYPYLETVYLGFNMADPVLGKNADLRKALALAYDQKTATTKFYNDQALTAHSPLAPEIDGFDPRFKNPYKEYSLEKAKEFLKKAGYPEGKGLAPIEFSIASSTQDRQMAEFVSQQFGKIGVKVNIASNSWPQFIERLNNKKAQMFGIAWGADYPDQDNMLQTLYGPNASPGPNNANYSSKEFDALFEKAEVMRPGPERTVLIHKMRDQFVKDMPWIPTVHRIGNMVYHGWVHNMKRHETFKGSMYKYLRVDLDKKKELKSKL